MDFCDRPHSHSERSLPQVFLKLIFFFFFFLKKTKVNNNNLKITRIKKRKTTMTEFQEMVTAFSGLSTTNLTEAVELQDCSNCFPQLQCYSFREGALEVHQLWAQVLLVLLHIGRTGGPNLWCQIIFA
jgi:hypothetical protein